jgi:hypothetical protein
MLLKIPAGPEREKAAIALDEILDIPHVPTEGYEQLKLTDTQDSIVLSEESKRSFCRSFVKAVKSFFVLLDRFLDGEAELSVDYDKRLLLIYVLHSRGGMVCRFVLDFRKKLLLDFGSQSVTCHSLGELNVSLAVQVVKEFLYGK